MQKGMKLKYFTCNNYPIILDIFYKQKKSLKTTVQLLQSIHGVDLTPHNVFSSVLSCFFSYVEATFNRASYF